MANWANPLITTQYDVFVAEMKDRDLDTATMFSSSSTGHPTGSVRFNRTSKIFEEWNGSIWIALIIGLTGGGTGASSGAGAAAGLGLGTMAYQNSNAINVSGGTIVALTTFNPNCSVLPYAENAFDLGQLYGMWRNVFIQSGLIIPVGVDRYIVG